MLKKIIAILLFILFLNVNIFLEKKDNVKYSNLNDLIEQIFLPHIYASGIYHSPNLWCEEVGCYGGDLLCAFINYGPDPDQVVTCYDSLLI